MENSYPWAKALKISEIDLERWLEEAPPETHLLNWCLDHEKINPQEYYQWAKDHYGLAMLSEKFFNNPPNQELWNQIESVTNWSPNMVPIRQWDGVIFIACVEPQTQIPWSFPVQFLLAPRRELLNYWMNLHSSNTASATETKTSKPKEHVHSAQPEESHTKTQKIDQQQVEEVPNGFPVFNSDDDQSPEGLNLSENPASSEDVPVGFEMDVSSSSSNNEEDLFSGLESVPSQQSSAPTMDELESTVKITTPQENPMQAFESAETPPAPTESALDNQPEEVFESEVDESASDLEEATAILNTANVIQKQSPLIGELKTRYQNVVILKMQNEELMPLDWDSGLTVNRQAIDIQQPSFLKVVFKSQKPYHGYLAENQFHQNLFKLWGLDKLPDHVTAVPIVNGNKITEVVVGIGDEGCAGFQMIHFVESAIKNYPIPGTTASESKAA